MRKRVAIIYHFFANYRAPVLTRLDACAPFETLFCADRVNRSMPGVPVWTPENESQFLECRCVILPFGIMLQTGVISLAFRRDIDVIIYLGDWKFLSTWISAFVARLRGRRVLFWTHGWLAPESGLKGFARRCFYSLAHGLLLYGPRAKQIGIESGYDGKNLFVIYNSLDYDAQIKAMDQVKREGISASDLKQDLFQDVDLPVLYCCARLEFNKRFDLLIAAAAALRKRGTFVNVLLVGDGDERANLERAAELTDTDVVFVGRCYEPNALARYAMLSDVCVCPGPAGLSVIESMTFGCPVITTDKMTIQKPEVDAIIHGETGFFYQGFDLDSLVDTIQEFLQLPIEQRRLMSRRCQETVARNYTPRRQVENICAAVMGQPETNR